MIPREFVNALALSRQTASRLAARLMLFGLAVCFQGCGRRESTSFTQPSSPPAPAGPSQFTVVSGETGLPVGGAAVVFAGQNLRTDAQGVVNVPVGGAEGALVDIVAPGFLDRQTLFRTAGRPLLTLWPRTSPLGMDENFTAVLVYTATSDGAVTGGRTLSRHRASTTQVFLVLSANLAQDPEAVRWHQLAADSLNTAVEGRLIYRVVTDRPASGVVVDISYDPSNPGCGSFRAFTSWRASAGEITGATIVYCVSDAQRSGTVVHEIGHTFGLAHSPDPRDVMYFSFVRGRSDTFTPKEALAMKLMMGRSAGTRFPDNDRETSGLSAAEIENTIRCR